MSRFTAITPLFVCLVAGSARAQQPAINYTRRPITAKKTATPPTIDGDISDPVWKDAPKAETFIDVQNGTVVQDQTTAWLLYDEKYIYVAFHAKDSQPDRIIARETVRDNRYNNDFDQLSEDAVEVGFDTFNTHRQEDHSYFAVNAIGTRSARRAGGRASKLEWKGDWDAAVKKVADGWTAEMRIPWESLNYPSSKDPVNLTINFARFHNRTRILSLWNNIGPQGFYENEGVWQGVVVPAGAFKPRLSLLPYILPGINKTDPVFRSGLDARYPITPELTVVGSINPDFGTIEGAVEGIQFSRTERFVPETRPFFLEGLDYFANTNVNIIGQLYYPRRIETFDAGLKVYGKLPNNDTLGFLHTEDFGDRSDTIMRYRHDIGQTHSASVYFANLESDTDHNTVGGLLNSMRWGKFGIDWKAFITGGKFAGGEAEEGAMLYMDKHFIWALGGANVSPTFRNAEGLTGFTGYRGPIAQVIWTAEWRKGPFRRFNLVNTPLFFWHTDGRPFQRGVQSQFRIETRSDWAIQLLSTHMKFDSQTDETYGIQLIYGASNRFRQIGALAQTGREGGHSSTFVGPQFSFRVFRRLDIAYAGAVQNLAGVNQQHITTLNYELSPTRSIGGRIVLQNGATNWYLSYRNSGAKGLETYFILGDPNALKFRQQALVKLVFAL